MSPGILGKKIGMSQVFAADGQAVPVTLLKAGPCMVVQRKTPATDGYDAVQLGLVEFVGVSKGRGFAGVVKRHHFRGGEGSHGSMFHRAPGSIGASSFPSRVLPGMRMGGHMGSEQVTVRNLEIIEVDTEDNVLMVKGAVPGPNGGYVVVRRAKR